MKERKPKVGKRCLEQLREGSENIKPASWARCSPSRLQPVIEAFLTALPSGFSKAEAKALVLSSREELEPFLLQNRRPFFSERTHQQGFSEYLATGPETGIVQRARLLDARWHFAAAQPWQSLSTHRACSSFPSSLHQP